MLPEIHYYGRNSARIEEYVHFSQGILIVTKGKKDAHEDGRRGKSVVEQNRNSVKDREMQTGTNRRMARI